MHNHAGVSERVDPADVIRVEVGEHDGADRARLDPDRAKPRWKLVVDRQLEAREPEERVPARKPSRRRGPCRLAGVEEHGAVEMLDEEGIDR